MSHDAPPPRGGTGADGDIELAGVDKTDSTKQDLEHDVQQDLEHLEFMQVDRFTWEKHLRDHDDILGNRLLVLLTLGIYMRADGSNARPARATLATKTGLHPGTVGRHLTWAREHGYLERVTRGHRRGDGISMPSIHRATVPTASLPRNESDLERAQEILYRAPDGSLPRSSASLPRNESATITVFEDHVLRNNTAVAAACDQCDDSGTYEQDGALFACAHPLLAKCGTDG